MPPDKPDADHAKTRDPEATRKRILQGQKINEVLKQSDLDPMPVEEQVCVFYAVLNNYFESIPVEDIQKTERALVEYLAKLHEGDILKPIRETGLFDEAVENKLKEAIARFLAK